MQDDVSELLKAKVAAVLAQEVSAALGLDETSLEVLEIMDGVARIKLAGPCGGCPSSIMTVVMGIEETLRRQAPEIEYVEFLP